MRDVRENQPRFRRAPRTRAVGRWLAVRIGGVLVYVGLVIACAIFAPEALLIAVPGALGGILLHVGRGRVWVGLASAILIAGSIGAFAHQFGWPPFTDSPIAAEGHQGSNEITYDNLTVANVGGRYGGTVELTNHTDVHADMSVTVHVYDGEQDVGAIDGYISLKPHSTGILDLEGYDQYRPFTDTVVELFGLPASVQ